jgi:hypothetical protein
MINMRLSALQSDTLYLLTALEARDITKPIDSVALLALINKARSPSVFASSFRASMHKLAEHGLIARSRDMKSLKLSYRMTEQGRAMGIEITAKRAEQDEQAE